jgi:hypothetical protein
MVRYTVYSEHLTAFLFYDSSNVLIYFFLMGRSNQRLSLLDGKDELDDYLRVGIRHVLSLRVNLPFVDTGYKHRAPTGRGATRRRLLQTSRPYGARRNAATAVTNIAPLRGEEERGGGCYKHRAPTGRGGTRRRLLQTSRPYGARRNAAAAATNIAPLRGEEERGDGCYKYRAPMGRERPRKGRPKSSAYITDDDSFSLPHLFFDS